MDGVACYACTSQAVKMRYKTKCQSVTLMSTSYTAALGHKHQSLQQPSTPGLTAGRRSDPGRGRKQCTRWPTRSHQSALETVTAARGWHHFFLTLTQRRAWHHGAAKSWVDTHRRPNYKEVASMPYKRTIQTLLQILPSGLHLWRSIHRQHSQ